MRERVVASYEQGVPAERIADGPGTGRSGTRRIRQDLTERGTLGPVEARTGYASGLPLGVGRTPRDLAAAEPGVTRAVPRERPGRDGRRAGRGTPAEAAEPGS